MQVKEILRVKGNRLLKHRAHGPRSRRGQTMAKETSARWWSSIRGAWVGMLTSTSSCAAREARGSLGDLKVTNHGPRPGRGRSRTWRSTICGRTMLESGARYPLPVMAEASFSRDSFRDVARPCPRRAGLREQDAEGLYKELARVPAGYFKTNWPASSSGLLQKNWPA